MPITLNPAVGWLRDGAESLETTAMGPKTTSLVVHPFTQRVINLRLRRGRRSLTLTPVGFK
jgi:hypothetical protein